MNTIEAMKLERDGLAVRDMIAHYATSGWESIPETDVQRLKWYGLFLRNPTPGYFMVRVRIPGGHTSSYQLRALAEIASTYGNGLLDLTTRQQVQLRHIRIEDVPAVFARMDAVGLTSLQTGMDNVRNVMTCAVSGLNPDEVVETAGLVRAINEEILGNAATEARVMPLDEAQKTGAMMLFGEKYGDEVRVLAIGSSKELCGGTHVARTGDIGLFKVVMEGGVAAGVRRIEAVCGDVALARVQEQQALLDAVAAEVKAQPAEAAQLLLECLRAPLQRRERRQLFKQSERSRPAASARAARRLGKCPYRPSDDDPDQHEQNHTDVVEKPQHRADRTAENSDQCFAEQFDDEVDDRTNRRPDRNNRSCTKANHKGHPQIRSGIRIGGTWGCPYRASMPSP